MWLVEWRGGGSVGVDESSGRRCGCRDSREAEDVDDDGRRGASGTMAGLTMASILEKEKA